MITATSLGYLGRLGNQMFQYGLLLGVRARTGAEIVLRPDNLAGLRCFGLGGCRVMPDLVPARRYEERGASFHFDEGVYAQRGSVDYCGYFQSYRYLEPAEREIRSAFSFRPEVREKAKSQLRSVRAVASGRPIVAVHVRRGDYLNHPNYHRQFNMKFFRLAREQLDVHEPLYMVYSDDVNWGRKRFVRPDEIVMDVPDAAVAMCLASSCDHFVCSASSFGWWAAWLQRDSSKRVIVPSPWFGPDYPWDEAGNQMSPPEWIKLSPTGSV